MAGLIMAHGMAASVWPLVFCSHCRSATPCMIASRWFDSCAGSNEHSNAISQQQNRQINLQKAR